MIVGFSLSPGGLLLPYHLGALAALAYHGFCHDATPLAGSSAGAIAVASHAAGVKSTRALDASIQISSKCNPLFVARGGLLPSLQQEMERLFPQDAHEIINQREGIVALCHRELFPQQRSVMVSQFETRACLMDAVMDSSTFPYFLTNQPVRTVRRRNKALPRVVVDGVFAVPLERIGCPDFNEMDAFSGAFENEHDQEVLHHGGLPLGLQLLEQKVTSSNTIRRRPPRVDRTVCISAFPRNFLALSTARRDDQIGPELDVGNAVVQTAKLVRMMTQASSSKELTNLYESGWGDAEKWVTREKRRQRLQRSSKRETNISI